MNGNDAARPVLVLFAPTASGKTALLQTLFARSSLSFFNGMAEIVSADSMQVYRGLDIGTAKPDAALLSELPHHLIDICDPHDFFSAADFAARADDACADIFSRGKLPVVSGGTGFYIRSFMLGLPDTPAVDAFLRAKLHDEMQTLGAEKMWERLLSLDPESALIIHKNDAYRIQRALEIVIATGKKRSFFAARAQLRKPYDFCTIILTMPRETLYERIDARVDQMFRAGLSDEVQKLIDSGCTEKSPAMRAIGYREWFSPGSEDEIKSRIKAASRAYAKKQYTYMHNIPGALVFPYDGSAEAARKIAETAVLPFLKKYEMFRHDKCAKIL
ncbi:tRNA (adenosine(37)-N6)-dimethylallyltransferase MiaA [Treponema socranskii]|uniref:tRNA (adenosine(37)-N6)-dimethylallyltransferase MiaA n=1 Tax=Treponema socranskii TaxID=53419 RepID=UPI003D6E1C1D